MEKLAENEMNTYTGLHFNPMKIQPENISIEDIAHALSLLCRGAGHLKYFYSVGQHSVNCAREAISRQWSQRVALACLLHDGSEAYIADIIRPVKKHVKNYLEIEEMIMGAILDRFGLGDLSEEEREQVRQIDNELLEHELPALIPYYKKMPGSELSSKPDFSLRNFQEVEKEFLDLFQKMQIAG